MVISAVREKACGRDAMPDQAVSLESALMRAAMQLAGNALVDFMQSDDKQYITILRSMEIIDRTVFQGSKVEVGRLWDMSHAYRTLPNLPDDPQNMRKAYTAVLQALYIDPIPEVFELEPMDFIAALELCREEKTTLSRVL